MALELRVANCSAVAAAARFRWYWQARVDYCTDAAATPRIECSWNYEWFIAAMQLGWGWQRNYETAAIYASNVLSTLSFSGLVTNPLNEGVNKTCY